MLVGPIWLWMMGHESIVLAENALNSHTKEAPAMDEESLETAIQTYSAQLQQVDLALGAGLDPAQQADLIQLQADLRQLIELTEASLLSVKKSKLCSVLDTEALSTPSSTHPQQRSGEAGHPNADDEYAAFKEAIEQIGEEDGPLRTQEDRGGVGDEEEEQEEEEEEEEKK
ncbi:putative Zinc finger CCCH-type with G patch domain protein [Naja naja]|nr:putative Zinc finger CCCH-type with G patch domain protein [Naja naja]